MKLTSKELLVKAKIQNENQILNSNILTTSEFQIHKEITQQTAKACQVEIPNLKFISQTLTNAEIESLRNLKKQRAIQFRKIFSLNQS